MTSYCQILLRNAHRRPASFNQSHNEQAAQSGDDSTVIEPGCDLYPRVMPSMGDKARSLTGGRGAYSNAAQKMCSPGSRLILGAAKVA
jgi:hypothetical protein